MKIFSLLFLLCIFFVSCREEPQFNPLFHTAQAEAEWLENNLFTATARSAVINLEDDPTAGPSPHYRVSFIHQKGNGIDALLFKNRIPLFPETRCYSFESITRQDWTANPQPFAWVSTLEVHSTFENYLVDPDPTKNSELCVTRFDPETKEIEGTFNLYFVKPSEPTSRWPDTISLENGTFKAFQTN